MKFCTYFFFTLQMQQLTHTVVQTARVVSTVLQKINKETLVLPTLPCPLEQTSMQMSIVNIGKGAGHQKRWPPRTANHLIQPMICNLSVNHCLLIQLKVISPFLFSCIVTKFKFCCVQCEFSLLIIVLAAHRDIYI